MEFCRLNPSLAKREIVGQELDACLRQSSEIRIACVSACCENAVLYKKHRDLVAALLQRGGHLLNESRVTRLKRVSRFDQDVVCHYSSPSVVSRFLGLHRLKREFGAKWLKAID